jgi:antitoxin component of RelBE/YafQ-DinJ toxin-antitoxin module
MGTIELMVDESLLAEAEKTARSMDMTPSDFIRVALERAVQQIETISMERKHAQGYARQPQTSEEVSEWDDEQDWS